MATAYAAFTSLTNLITQLHEHPYPPIRLEEKRADSLNSNICFFRRFLEDHHNAIDLELETRIADAAHAAEDLIESYVMVALDFCRSLQRMIEGMDCIKQEVTEMNLNEPSRQGSNQPLRTQQSPSATSGENVVVGIEDITLRIVDKFTSSQHKSGRQIISISGMGGIGKTTLARKVYDHPYIKNYFDFFAWATISKNYDTRESLVEILRCLYNYESKDSFSEKSEYELGEQIYQYLSGRRYLVILDDVWDLEAWDKLRSYFPTSRGVGGIVITSRESKFASISSHSFRMDLLDMDKSWDLFCKRVFGQDCCPVELANVGKVIAKKCRGLPLSIVVIGSHLAKSPRTQAYWEYVAQNLSSVVNSEDDDRCLKIISLSYTHLPVHLKPCFLYTAIFPEDEDIEVSRLTNLWVAEGFVKPIIGKSLEEAAKDYLNDLVNRNLILDSSKSSLRGRMSECKIHDLLRDFCLKEVTKTNFLRIVQKPGDLRVSDNERRMVVHPIALEEASTTDLLSEEQELLESVGTQNKEPENSTGLNEAMVNHHHLDISVVLKARKRLRSLIFNGELPSLENNLLRVLAPFAAGSPDISLKLLVEVLHQMVNMRYLACSIGKCDEIFQLPSSIFLVLELPSSVFLLWNLHSLTIKTSKGCIKAPPEFWKMRQLRHINTSRLILPHPPSEESNGIILENLQSAQNIANFNFCDEVVRRIPNIKKLDVFYDGDYEGFDEGVCTLSNVDRLQKLETFTCDVNTKIEMLRNLTFPHSLKELYLYNLHWDDVTTRIGSLPLLEVLTLPKCKGSEWELVEGQFVKLKSLGLLECRSLRYLTANNNYFPCLQRLFMYGMDSLEGISSEIGDIPTLELILLFRCPDSAVASGKEIADEQYNNGNQELQVSATVVGESSLSESLGTWNFHINLF